MSPEILNSCRKLSYRTLRIFRVQGEKVTRKCYILGLPFEILEHIVTYLPLPDKVCLTLSCKDLHELFKPVLEAEELRFPLLFQKRGYVMTEEYHQRMTLLIQLENSGWACCARCQKLHPRKEFSDLWEEYLLLEPSSPWSRKCTTWAGILDLCPCIAMTLRDRKHIVEYLSGTRECRKPVLNLIRKGLLQDSLNEKGERCLSHTCPARKSVQLDITLALRDSGRLTSCAKYGASVSASRRLESIGICCGVRRLSWCLNNSATYTCGSCHAQIVPLPHPGAGSDSRTVQVTRFLGKGAWLADSKSKTESGRYEMQWWRQCRDHDSYIPT